MFHAWLLSALCAGTPIAPSAGDCYEPQGGVAFPIDACLTYSLIDEVVQNLEQQQRFLRLLIDVLEGPGAMARTQAEFAMVSGLVERITVLMEAQVEGANWQFVQIVDGSVGAVDVLILPGQVEPAQYYLPQLDLSALQLDMLDVSTPEGLADARRHVPLVLAFQQGILDHYAADLASLAGHCAGLLDCE